MNTDSRNVIRTFNVGLIVTTLLIFTLGIITLYSATKITPGAQGLYKTQIIWFVLGLVLSIGILFIDSPLLEKLAYPSYVACLVLLIIVLFFGQSAGGSQRWISLGSFNLQPSEFAKIAIVFAFAKYFRDEKGGPPYTLKRLVIPGLLVAPYAFLILLQPDIGTAGILVFSASSIVLFLRVQWRSVLIVAIVGLITLPLSYRYVLKEYQRDRVKTFLDPGRDPRGSGYNALQCKIAVGSGKLFGKGYLKGTQAKGNFIPEQHTDFIFSVYSEERGFVGGLILLVLNLFYCLFSLRTVARARDKFSMLLAFGLTSIFFWHVFINLGMVSGILPIVGVTLPFFSYGGSSMLTFMITTSLLLNLSRKKYIF